MIISSLFAGTSSQDLESSPLIFKQPLRQRAEVGNPDESDDSRTTCSDQPCKNGAICREREIPASIYFDSQNRLPYECQCLYGWEGENCTENVDDCKDNPCLNGGVCEDQPNARYICHCPAGYIGRKCEHRDPCLESPCENGGQCQSSPLGDYQCFCPRWYEGTNCEIAKQPCKRNSTCREGTDHCEVLYESFEAPSARPGSTPSIGSRISGFRCVCKPGFEGALCEREIDHCRNHRCQNGAQCVNLIDRYRCVCASGFTGDYCQNILTAPSEPRPNSPHEVSDSEMNRFCESIGCSGTNMTLGTCNGRCVLAGCFDDQQLRACSPWMQCLEATKHTFRVGEASCVERFRDGICDRECAISSCFQDGFDCVETG
nr:unnamed protein product [Spirometra erinaceieuropaei]